MDAIDTSKSHKLYLLLKERIRSGVLAPGARLPTEQQLGEAHQMSRVTVRRALEGLDRDGLITRQAGSGTFVKDTPSPARAVVGDLVNMIGNLMAMGRETRVRLLAFNYGAPPEPVAKAMKMAEGERAQHALRVRTLDGLPFSYLSTYVPERIGLRYSGADLAERPLLELLERSGVVAVSAEQTISATLAGPEAAEALEVEIGSPLIALTRVILGQDGRGVEYLAAQYRPDRYQFNMHMERAKTDGTLHWRLADPAAKPPAKPHRTRRVRAARPKQRTTRRVGS